MDFVRPRTNVQSSRPWLKPPTTRAREAELSPVRLAMPCLASSKQDGAGETRLVAQRPPTPDPAAPTPPSQSAREAACTSSTQRPKQATAGPTGVNRPARQRNFLLLDPSATRTKPPPRGQGAGKRPRLAGMMQRWVHLAWADEPDMRYQLRMKNGAGMSGRGAGCGRGEGPEGRKTGGGLGKRR